MEKKNTILLTVIAVATLLVAVVGATFAYFTASTSGSGTGNSQNVTTSTVGNVTLELGNKSQDVVMDYPGGKAVVALSVTPTKDSGDSNNYDVVYNVIGSIEINGLDDPSSTISYTLYRVAADTAANISDPVQSCSLQEDTQDDGTTHYYYTGCTVDTNITSGENVASDSTQSGNTTLDVKTTSLQSSNINETYYYYLVVDYQDTGEEQDDDQNASVTISLTGISDGNATISNP